MDDQAQATNKDVSILDMAMDDVGLNEHESTLVQT
jgi:hypothetical protein